MANSLRLLCCIMDASEPTERAREWVWDAKDCELATVQSVVELQAALDRIQAV